MGLVVGPLVVLPLLMLAGSRGASRAELEGLQTANESLKIENESYREATGELTVQIATLKPRLHSFQKTRNWTPRRERRLPDCRPSFDRGRWAATRVPLCRRRLLLPHQKVRLEF
jgi:hypothetical protein